MNKDVSAPFGIAGIVLSLVLFFYGYVASKYQTLQPCYAAARIVVDKCGYTGCGLLFNIRTTRGVADELTKSKDHGRLWCLAYVTQIEVMSMFE